MSKLDVRALGWGRIIDDYYLSEKSINDTWLFIKAVETEADWPVDNWNLGFDVLLGILEEKKRAKKATKL